MKCTMHSNKTSQRQLNDMHNSPSRIRQKMSPCVVPPLPGCEPLALSHRRAMAVAAACSSFPCSSSTTCCLASRWPGAAQGSVPHPSCLQSDLPGHYCEARGKNSSTSGTQLLANAAVPMGTSPQIPLVSEAPKARLFATEWPGCDYGSVPTGDLLDYGEMPKTATIFGSTPRRRGHPRGCSQQAETVSGCLLGTNGSSTAGPTFLSTPRKSNKHLCRASA